jgi:hypothetical protein
MPITNIKWAKDWNRDLHVLYGQTSPDLTQHALIFEHADGETPAAEYMNDHPGEVELVFRPLFWAVEVGGFLEANGLRLDFSTGELQVVQNPAPERRNNFIVEVTAKNTGDDTEFTAMIRMHVHASVTRIWLTPATLTVRPSETADDLPFRFTVRAEFDDHTAGDVTLKHGVTWEPPLNFDPDQHGIIHLRPTDVPGNTIDVTATLPTPGGASTANGTISIAPRWQDEPNLPRASIVPGGGWPGTLKPERAPNVLFLSCGFPESAEGDDTPKKRFEKITDGFVHYMKLEKSMRPFDLLATSINFWRAFLPAETGVSVRSEVYTRGADDKLVARPVPIPVRPPSDNKPWKLKHLVYAVGLPIPADADKDDDELREVWSQELSDDPGARATEKLIREWKRLANRTFIDEIDVFPSVSYGEVPAAERDFGYTLELHDDRGGVGALRQLYPQLTSDSEVALDGGRALGNLWAEDDIDYDFDNRDLVVLLTSFSGGRARNGSGFIALSTRSGNVDLPVTATDVGGRRALVLKPHEVPKRASVDSSRTMTHELAHSFGLGDEYGKGQRFQDQTDEFEHYGNLTTELHVKNADGDFDGDEIRWNWHRIKRAAVLSDSVSEPSAGVFKIPVRSSEALQFRKGDKLLLRVRERKLPLPKHPLVLSEDKLLEVGIEPEPDFLLAVAVEDNAEDVVLDDFEDFGPGSIVYVPTPAPASAVAETQFAEMIALNVKNEITEGDRPLTPVPCRRSGDGDEVQTPDLTDIDIRCCFSHKPRIVGLYEGGKQSACGVFHPTGTCMMRDDHDTNTEFCAVCRYVIVDFINPYHHSAIDRDYAEIYPQPD